MQTIDNSIDARSKKIPLILSLKRRELLAWFKGNAPSLAEAYEGAIHLIADENFPGRIHFISHAVRDITDRLAFALDSGIQSKRVQYEYAMDKIQAKWKSINPISDETIKIEKDATVTISYEVALQIDAIVTAHKNRRSRSSNYDLLFRFLMRQEPTNAQVNERLVENFKRLHKWFMDLTHLRTKYEKVPHINESELKKQFEVFEGILHSFVGNFFTGTEELDEILKQANQ
jgi:hypothetical protein